MCVFSDPLVSGQTPPLIYQGELQGDGGKVEDSLRFQAYLQPPPPFFLSPLWRPHGAHQGKREEEAKKTHWKLQPCIQIVFTYLHKKKKNQRGLTPDLETYMELRRSVHVRFVYLLIKSVHRKWGLPSKVNPVNFVLELQYVRFSNLPKQGPSKPMGAAYHC